MSILFERTWEIFTKNQRAYFILNALYYGVMFLFMIYLNFDTNLRDNFVDQYHTSFQVGAPSLAGQPFSPGTALQTLMGNFVFNLMGSTYGEITLPSFIIPFIGILIGLYRAAGLGMAFSPANPTAAGIFLPHLPTLILEGQAVVFAMLGTYIYGRALLWPRTIGQTSRWKAFIEGVRQSGMLYLPIMVVLLLSAIYGFIEVALLAMK
jgi:hypothetical protein